MVKPRRTAAVRSNRRIDPDDFAALMSYSPYHRALESALRAPGRPHPEILLTGFAGDTRTDAAHPRKMCAALLAAGLLEEGGMIVIEHGRETPPDIPPPLLLRDRREYGAAGLSFYTLEGREQKGGSAE